MIAVSIVTWTPAMAVKALATNPSNRKVRRLHVDRMKADLIAGRFIMNGQPVILSDSRVLLDGQHRLMMVAETGIPVEFVTVTGVRGEAFKTIDTGISRTASTVVQMMGQKRYRQTAAFARIVAASRRQGGLTAVGINQVSTAETIEVISEGWFAPIMDWAEGVRKDTGLSATLVGAAVYLIAGKDGSGEVQAWLGSVCRGVGLTAGTTEYSLFRYLRDVTIKDSSDRMAVLAVIIKAWNAHEEGRNVLLMRYNRSEAFPTVVGRELATA